MKLLVLHPRDWLRAALRVRRDRLLPLRRLANGAALAGVAVTSGCQAPAPTGGEAPDRLGLPPLMLWAWERPEDLRALEQSTRAGVAVLAATITLRGDEVEVRPRHQGIELAPTTAVCPVVRVEVSRLEPALLDEAQRHRVVDAIVRVARRHEQSLEPGGAATSGRVQIDFEATTSQRAFYRAVLVELRARLGPRAPIAITALASWCLGDRWISDLPVDEVVPMYYRLGPRAAEAAELLARVGDFPAPECRAAIGLSLDEAPSLPARWPPSPRRTWIFTPRPWSAERIAAVLRAPLDLAAAAPERKGAAAGLPERSP